MIFFVASFFKLVTIEISNVFWACGLVDIFTIGSVIMAVIRLGVQINTQIHKDIGYLLEI